MKLPPESLQMLLSKPITIASSWRRMVGCAIAFDGQYKSARLRGILGNEINSVFGSAELGNDLHPVRCQRIHNIHLKVIQWYLRGRCVTVLPAVRRGILDVIPQQFHAAVSNLLWIHIEMVE